MTEDEASFEDFYRATASRLIGQVALLTGDREEARDCVHEAMERAWLRWGHVRALHDPESLGPHGGVADRDQPLAPGADRGPAHAAAPAAGVVRRPRGRRRRQPHARGGPAAAPRRPAVALVLYHVCDLDIATVAQQTNSSVSAVKSRLHRGRKTLAETLGDPSLADDGNRDGNQDGNPDGGPAPERTTLQTAFQPRPDDAGHGFLPNEVA